MGYFLHLGVYVCISIISSLALNLVVGYAGLLVVCIAAFSGVGAYVFSILLVDHNVNFFLAQALGVAGAMLSAGVIGLVLSRFRGDYYALCSMGFNVIVTGVLVNMSSITHGALGVPGIGRPIMFGYELDTTADFLAYAAVTTLLVYLICRFIVKSSFGRVLKAIREDETALQVFGYRASFYKFTIFVIAAGMAAIGGMLFASYITFIDPTFYVMNESVYFLSAIILGGLGSLRGSIIGAVVLQLLPEVLRFVGLPGEVAGQVRQLIYGALLVILMINRPRGLLGEYKF